MTEVDDARRLPEILSRAFQTCLGGRPGPVVIALPEDMLDDIVHVADVARSPGLAIAPTGASMKTLGDLLSEAQRPAAALARCLANDGPSLLEIRLPPDAPFTPGE